MVYSTRDFFYVLTLCYFVLVFFSPFSIAITSIGKERANLSAFRMFVRFVLVWFYRFPLPLCVWKGLRFVIVALSGLFSSLFFYSLFHISPSLGILGKLWFVIMPCVCSLIVWIQFSWCIKFAFSAVSIQLGITENLEHGALQHLWISSWTFIRITTCIVDGVLVEHLALQQSMFLCWIASNYTYSAHLQTFKIFS